MSNRTYIKTTGVIFTIIALAHLLRIINGTAVVLGTITIPILLSWIAVLVAGYLAYQGLRKR
jgi:hypothetical protein